MHIIQPIMDIPVLVHPNYRDRPSVEEAISIVNALQMQFHLEFKEAQWLPNGRNSKVGRKALDLRIRKNHRDSPILVVIENPLKGDLFDFQARGIAVVSTEDWNERYAPPPLRIWLVYMFACAFAPFAADLPDEQIDKMFHERMRGCISDSTSGKRELRIGLVSAHLCAECEAKLAEWGVSDQSIEAIVEVLAYVRAFAIRRPRSTPSHVFIGHGRHDDWKEIASFLSSMDVKVDEFNSDPTAGITTVERLREMIERACFAFLVMTPEDAHGDGKRHARENVVHEIGLFQAKLGFHRAIVVRQAKVEAFSNIAGLTYLPYVKGKIRTTFPQILQTLVREGVLDPRNQLVKRATNAVKKAGSTRVS
jgi:hypothetical protein